MPATSATGNPQQPRKLEVNNEEELDQKMGDLKIQDSLPHAVSYFIFILVFLSEDSFYWFKSLICMVCLVVLTLISVVISVFLFM